MSKSGRNGTTPSSESSPWVGFSPTRSFQAAGTRADPAVSEPMPAAARPKATEAAAPEDDPPGVRSGSLMLGDVAVIGLMPRTEKASSLRWVLPRQTSPALAAADSTAASRVGVRPASSADPASVGTPAVSNRSFQLIGTPSSGPRRSPARARARAASDSARARSGVLRA